MKKNKIRLVKTTTSILSCKVCGNNVWETWLESENGITGIYCKKCGRRIGSGFPR